MSRHCKARCGTGPSTHFSLHRRRCVKAKIRETFGTELELPGVTLPVHHVGSVPPSANPIFCSNGVTSVVPVGLSAHTALPARVASNFG